MMFGIAPSVGVIGFLLLELATVQQQDTSQLASGRRRINGPPISFPYQHRQVSAVVEVSVGQNDGVQVFDRHRKRFPVAQAQLLVTLKQPAIDQHTPLPVFDEVFAASHGAGGTQKCQSHRDLQPSRSPRKSFDPDQRV
ncbi:hypothetical protein D3C84_829280 [compost metagenome]